MVPPTAVLNVGEAPEKPFQVNKRLLPPKSITLPGVDKLAVNDNGEVPYIVKLLVKFNPLPFPAKVRLFNFLLAGIDASSPFTTDDVAGEKKFSVRLYKAIRAVGVTAAVVYVPEVPAPDAALPKFNKGAAA